MTPRAAVELRGVRLSPDLLLAKARQVSGAVTAPFAQALSSLVIQVVALRELGAEGFGVYALLYGGLVLLTALQSGLVGDSLTVLDRHDSSLRAGLVLMAVGTTLASALVGAVIAVGAGLLGPVDAAIFALGVVVFLVENLLRRILMATMHFWRTVMVDVAVLLGTVAPLAVALAADHAIVLGDVLWVLVISQTVGLLVGFTLLDRSERRLGELRKPYFGAIARFGGWRAAQQGIRPGSLMVFRVIVVMMASTALFGELEAARIYTSPAMLIVSGVATYYLASYAGQKNRSLDSMLRRADLGVVFLVLTVAIAGLVAFCLMPLGGPLVTDGAFDLSPIAVAGWLLYAGISAMGVPYGSLASVRGDHAFVVWVRTVEVVLSLVLVAAMLTTLGGDVDSSPFGLCIGAAGGVWVIRRRLAAQVSAGRPLE